MPTTAAEHCVHHRDLASALAPGDTLTRAPVWARWYLAPSMLTFGPGVSRELVSAECDTVLYVQEGSGTLRLGGERHEIGPGLAAFAAAGQPWSVENPGSEPVVMAEVLVPDPEPAGAPYAAVRLDGSADDEATGGRSFRLLCTPAQGCNSVTQFVGYIPPGRAPDHYHRYDEFVLVLDGPGRFHVDGTTVPIESGSCIHFPATMVHSVENCSDRELRVMGVFRPVGTPAEAYYPDGTLAFPVPEDERVKRDDL